MKKINNLTIGLTTPSRAWNDFLAQEIFPVENLISANKKLDHPILICDSQTDLDFDQIDSCVSKGGYAIISSLYFSQYFSCRLFSERKHVLFPDADSNYSSLEALEINQYIFYDINSTWLDKNLKIALFKHGEGYLIILPFELDDVMKPEGIKRKKFYANREELPSERVAETSFGMMRKLLKLTVEYCYNQQKLPILSINYFPNDWDNIFCFRVDTDFCSEAEAEKLYELCQKYKIKATWFVDTQDAKRLESCYAKFKDQEIGLHCHRHLVFPDLESNLENISKGLDALKKSRIEPIGFAAPFGEWNLQLDEALQQNKFFYSSEFGYDYDNLPSRFTIKSPWQIPVHPISSGRLRRSHFSLAEMKQYFRDVVNHHLKRRIPIIFYHHPHHGMQELIEDIFKNIIEKKISILNMQEFAEWWDYRNKISYKAFLGNDKILIESESFPDQVGLIIKQGTKTGHQPFVKDFSVTELCFTEETNIPVPADYKRIYKFHWRDLLYDFESRKGKRKL